MEIIKAFPWRTAIFASIGYLVLSLPVQLIAHGDPSILSWVLWVAMGPALTLNIKVASEEPREKGTFLGGMAALGMLIHLCAYASTLISPLLGPSVPASEVMAGLTIGGLLLVVAAWMAQQTIQGICWFWETIIGWISQEWK